MLITDVRLGADNFATREAAERDLRDLDWRAIHLIEDAAASTGDLEVRTRLERLLPALERTRPEARALWEKLSACTWQPHDMARCGFFDGAEGSWTLSHALRQPRTPHCRTGQHYWTRGFVKTRIQPYARRRAARSHRSLLRGNPDSRVA